MASSKVKKLYIFVDESGTDAESPVLYMTIVVTDLPEKIRSDVATLIGKLTLDPELSSKIPSVRKNGINFLHYAADHPEIRSEVITLLPSLNFDAYLAFLRKDEIVGDLSKVQLLKLLLEDLLRPRLLEKHYLDIEIVYERFDEGRAETESEFSREVSELCKSLSQEFGKNIKSASLSFSTKEELCLGIPDYLCGVVADYFDLKFSGKQTTDSWQERNYYRTAGKIRMIHDLTRKRFYSRKDPLHIESI